ncbi:MAG: hypothetical protein AB7L66_03225 [Gemmatimonadales bacterium]
MTPMDTAIARARARAARVALIGQGDGTMTAVAARLAELGLSGTTIVGPDGLTPGDDPRLAAVAGTLRECWPERVRDGIHALDLAANPLLFAAGLTARGEVDVCLGGTAVPADAMEEAARWVTGPDRASRGRGHLAYVPTGDGRLLTMAVPDSAGPLDARGVAALALNAADHRSRVLGDTPRVGLLVAPPTLDASHADAELAIGLLRELAPGVAASVEWSWSPLEPGDPARFRHGPNVLIFPDPVTGHLAELLLRDAAGLRARGPLFPGGKWVLAGAPDGAAVEELALIAVLAAAGLAGA